MAYFDALNVSGDAFLLMTRSARVLVDGGRSTARLVTALDGVDTLDAVICTHNDADHAGGLVSLLGYPKAPKVAEVWLPGRWADQLEDLLLHPETFARELIDEIEEVWRDFGARMLDWPPPDDDADDSESTERAEVEFDDLLLDHALPPDVATEPDGARGELTEAWTNRLAQALKTAATPPTALTVPPVDATEAATRSPRDVARLRAVVQASIDAANRIQAIALSALTHGVRIRWFDFETFDKGAAPSGGWPWLVPVNACELIRLPTRPPVNRLAYLTLTKVNRECLVFQVVEGPKIPGVLFCGDSPLEGGRRKVWPGLPHPATRGHLVTAPHHGRASNAGAYAIVNRWLFGARGRTFWVKSGSSSPPCPELRAQPWRLCTGCTARPGANAPLGATPDYWWALQWPPCTC